MFYQVFLLQLILIMVESATLNKRQENNPCQSSPDSLNHPWPNGVIPYLISPAVPDSLRTPLHFALQKVEGMSCVQFLPRTTQADYVLIKYGERCCSHSGLVGSGRQLLYVSEICINGNETLSETISKLANIVGHNYCQTSCGASHVIIPGSNPGQVSSPGYSSTPYPPHSNCVWRLWIPQNRTLNLHFVKISLETGHGCLYDYLNIFQEDKTGRIINTTRLCGSHANYHINTSNGTNVVSIHFSSDESNEKEGFLLKYSLLNDEVLCAVNNGGCSHVCNSDMQGAKMSCSCKPGYHLLSDNASCADINECPATCQQKCVNTVGSYYCHCKQGYGLTNDTETCQVCGGNLNLTHGIITPPGGHSSTGHSPYQNCKWTLSIWPGHYLNVTIKNLDIANSSDCSLDYLRPSHGRFRHKKRLCGQYRHIQYILHGSMSSTYFRFYSGPPSLMEIARKGFSIHFQQVPISEVSRTELKTVNINGTHIVYNAKYWV